MGVTRDGGFAELVRVPGQELLPLREGVVLRSGVHRAARVRGLRSGSRADRIGSEVLIIGAGPIGQLHLQASRANGAASVTVIDTVPSKLELAASSAPIAHRRRGQRARRKASKIARYGFDVVIDATGNPAAVEGAIKFVANGGKFLIFGVCSPDAKIDHQPVRDLSPRYRDHRELRDPEDLRSGVQADGERRREGRGAGRRAPPSGLNSSEGSSS